jgi:DNA (cytosine-5)-methyltransferase 1
MKIIDLFSGVGGFSLGLESTGGFETVQFVENEPWCQKILAKNFPEVPIAGDIREYEGQRADVVVGGFPSTFTFLSYTLIYFS